MVMPLPYFLLSKKVVVGLGDRTVGGGSIRVTVGGISIMFGSGRNGSMGTLSGVSFSVRGKRFVSLLNPSKYNGAALLHAVTSLLRPASNGIEMDGVAPGRVELVRGFNVIFRGPILFR